MALLLAGCGGFLLCGCETPQINVLTPLGVIDFAPSDGATDVDPAADEGVCFSESVNGMDLGVQISIEDSTNTPVAGLTVANSQVNGSTDPYCLDLAHPALATDSVYQIVVPQGLMAENGQTLAATITSTFRTATQ